MKAIKVFMVPRERDEELLDWLRLRAKGCTAISIARWAGKPAPLVRSSTFRVLEADLAESGEDPDVVRGAYA